MTDLTEVKTADLASEALNWSVAMAMGLNPSVVSAQYGVPTRVFILQEGMFPVRYKPSADWLMGGPLIDRLQAEILRSGPVVYAKLHGLTDAAGAGESTLIAACRAIVTARLGETVQVPKELLP
ncbi:phage protein NinX family protein [Pseudomonas auratipiscis]|uniref:Phage protein NinX family protein n=1 Tax=Pseudomonas auratipiscis TaxID=3115853 RepID=A0AB35WQC3_9PSED|nr:MULTISPECIES: phage protein NinX family protein [unclassified Pseudomonas]MEE1866890.1 phage protein NinX family protein [Pseudomonas sp. 120P]MEE1960588.1 phage protein NinX family protein [Pseudomonas sp. 119P]